jgi:hypothetical protein
MSRKSNVRIPPAPAKPPGIECPLCHCLCEPLKFSKHLDEKHPSAHPVRLQHSTFLRKHNYVWGTGKIPYSHHETTYFAEKHDERWKRDEDGMKAILRSARKVKKH